MNCRIDFERHYLYRSLHETFGDTFFRSNQYLHILGHNNNNSKTDKKLINTIIILLIQLIKKSFNSPTLDILNPIYDTTFVLILYNQVFNLILPDFQINLDFPEQSGYYPISQGTLFTPQDLLNIIVQVTNLSLIYFLNCLPLYN